MRPRQSFLTSVVAVAMAACACAADIPVLIEIPAVSPVSIERYREIIVEDFRETEAVEDVALGRRMAEYLDAELRREFRGTVSRRGPAGDPAAGLVVSGTVGIAARAQKALREADIVKDGPFGLEERGLVERKRFTLTVAYKVSDAATGEVILAGGLKESRTYGDIQQSVEFALVDLLPLVKAKLFPALFGRVSAAERYLLLR
jgi:hypothetical protein